MSVLLLFAGCSPSAEQRPDKPLAADGTDRSRQEALPVDFVSLPEGHSDKGWIADAHLELLCNPETHRLILQTSPPQYRQVEGYPKRHVWDVNELYVAISDGFRGDQGFTGSRRSFARCGDYVIVVEADKANGNWRGHEGAYDPYFAVKIANDFRTVYPNEEKYDHSGLVPMGSALVLWGEFLGLDEQGCPDQVISAMDVRPDLAAETTKVSLIVRDPDFEFKRHNDLDQKRDYSDCSRAVHGNATSISYWNRSGMRQPRQIGPWIY